MAFQYLTNAPLEQARRDYTALLLSRGFAPRTEWIPAVSACGRVTAHAVYARICAPHYPACAMDGIAIAARDSFGASETTPVTLAPDRFRPVDTGDPLPEGCDAVVMAEDLLWSEDGCVTLHAAAAPWRHVRQIGEDICAGEMILPSHYPVTPSAVGAMLAAGVTRLEVLCRPVVGIIPTGDELVPASSEPKPGDILEFNSAVFSSMLAQWGAESRVFPILPDDRQLIQATLEEAAAVCDLVLLNAGSSAGRDDYAAHAIGAVGEVLYHGVAIRPGKPVVLGCCGACPIVGVPGYPVSGILILEEFVRPLIELWNHAAPRKPELCEATLTRAVVSGLKYHEFVRVRMGWVGGRLTATPLGRGAGVVSSFMKADGILEVPQGTEGFDAGAAVPVRLLRPVPDPGHTFVVIGSHDPLLDEVADLLHCSDSGLYMSSSHVGSMGGIMAVRRGEAHAAGIHLLNEKDGSYNLSYLHRYFPQGGVRLVECVGRDQGLMVLPGNPSGLRSVADLVRPDLRYVNRQKGSGTRILFDYLCAREGVDSSAIRGYDREEMTHSAVAAQIAGGTADAGMGILSAAKMYELDFIPMYLEQYDLLIPDTAWDTPPVRRLLEVLASDEFRKRLEALGGYHLEQPGRVRAHL